MNEEIDLGIKARPLKTKGILIYFNENKDVIEVQEYIDNLQSKIDKAIELTNKIIDSGWDYHEKDNCAFQMLDILKEDKIKEIPIFKGTMEQLDKLNIKEE